MTNQKFTIKTGIAFLLFMLSLGIIQAQDYDPTLKPFYHGVASGDPLQDAVIIWTRVTPEHFMEQIPVDWYVATDKEMTNIVMSGTMQTDTSMDYTVKVDVTGLDAGTTYYYSFSALGGNSIVGKTKTTPSTNPEAVKLAIVVCSNYQAGYFNAYRKIAQRNDLDAVLHLGDYFYEYGNGSYGILTEERPLKPPHEVVSLEDYRTRYSHYRLDPDLRVVHQQLPFFAVWDDHESANDAWVGGAENHDPATEGDWEDRKQRAKKVYYEWMPIRPEVQHGDPLYRSFNYGNLVDVIMLDTRLAGREEQIYPQNDADTADWLAPDRTILGEDQKNWLKDQLLNSTAKWKVIGNQVMFSEFNVGWAADGFPVDTVTFASLENTFLDIWDGYPAERDTILDFITDNGIDNVVFATGDFHASFAFDVAKRPTIFNPWGDAPDYDPVTQNGSVAVEFLTPSISAPNFDENIGMELSAGFEMQINNPLPPDFQINPNPHMRWVDLDRHGYTIIHLNDTMAQGDFYYMETILEPESEETRSASLYAKDGENHLTETQAGSPDKSMVDMLAPDYPMPTVPENVYAQPLFYNQIELTWDDANGETYYVIERSSPDVSSFDSIAMVYENKTSYLDKEIMDGTTYYYRIKAANPDFTSDYSDTVMTESLAPKDFQMKYLGNYDSGLGEGATEIAAYDSLSKRLFIVNAEANTIDILDISDVENVTVYDTIKNLSNFGSGANSVAAYNGIVAVAVEGNTINDPGHVVFYDSAGTYLSEAVVGFLPDMVTFTPDGKKVLVACEGEPNDDYTIDPPGSVYVVGINGNLADFKINSSNPILFDAFNEGGTRENDLPDDVRIFGPGASVSDDLEPEYITVAVNGGGDTIAYVAFQENNAVGIINVESEEIVSIVSLGFKDFNKPGNAIDASNKDGAINIKNWPVYGMYQPDAIASYSPDGSNIYVLSANEGDARDYDGFTEEFRVKDDTIMLDPQNFPNADWLKESKNLGRLRVTSELGDIDEDGYYDTLYAYGARSFSVWSGTDGSLVWDSGDDFEQISAIIAPDIFNQDDGEVDGRSDDKGPEPEGIVVGEVDGRFYAFIGLERQGGVMVYDVTDPMNPEFILYERSMPENISPEGMVFLSAEESPSGNAMLIISNEVSGTVAFYEVFPTAPEMPQAPANPMARNISKSHVEVTWEATDTVDYYKLFRADSIDGSYEEITILPPTSTRYSDEVSDSYDDYFYSLKSFKSAVASDYSDTVMAKTDYVLQVLHASDLEGGVDAIFNAPNFAAIVDQVEEEFPASLTISSGDNWIPGPFFGAASDFSLGPVFNNVYEEFYGTPFTDLRSGVGRVDVSIMNIIGFDASAVGNHEFDAGTSTVSDIIGIEYRDDKTPPQLRWLGAQFPYLSANLDFTGDDNLSWLYTGDVLSNAAFNHEPSMIDENTFEKKIAPATIIERDGEYIGVVGATTQLLESITSNGDVNVKGVNENNMLVLADTLQPVIDSLIEKHDVNKIILATHLQQFALEQELIGYLSGVDIILAGGSDVLMAKDSDILHPGDTKEENYPFITANADGDTAIIVGTDGEYSYVGRLVVAFDENGVLRTGPGKVYDESGAYATLEEVVEDVWGNTEAAFETGTKGALVKTLVDEVDRIVTEQDGNTFGVTAVYLEGRRSQVRTQETNLGNLSSDANIFIAKQFDPEVKVAVKNGGGIRASIGEIVEVEPGIYEERPPQTNPNSGKQTGEISQLDIANSMRFNNSLTIVPLTAEELKMIAEHAVAGWAEDATPGSFGQVGGMAYSFDPAQQAQELEFTNNELTGIATPGERIRSLVIYNENGEPADVVVQNGEVVGNTDRIIKMVTLGFLAGGGDNYPFALASHYNERVELDTALTIDGDAIFTDPGLEQDALAEYLNDMYATDTFKMAETPVENDERIQNLNYRTDGLIFNLPATPSNLILTAVSTSQVDLSWSDEADNEWYYVIERSPDDQADNFVSIDTVDANVTSFSNTGLTENTEYFYRIKAVNIRGSVYSEVASETTMISMPAAPTSLTAAATSSSEIDLSWADNADNETSYVVERSLTNNDADFSEIASLATEATGYSDSGLDPDTEYFYRVGAKNDGGTVYSDVVSATTDPTDIAPLSFAEAGIHVYPNPSEGIINLTFSEELIKQDVSFKITDISGKVILRSKADNKQWSIDLSGEAKGIYFIYVHTNEINAIDRIILE